MVVLWISLSAIPLSSWGQGTLNMPTLGKQEVSVSDEIIFYDTKGEEDISSSSSNNACSSIVFKPAVEGKAIQISFEYFDVYTDGTSYPAFLKVYNGVFDADNTFGYPASINGVTVDHRFPFTSNQLDSLDVGKNGTALTNKTYVSSDPSGCLSVAYIYKYAGTCKGWKAKVSCVTVSDMQITAAGSSYEEMETGAYAGKQAVNLAGFYINTEGIMHPDQVTSVSFTLPVNEGVIDPMQLKLYEGAQANFKGKTPIDAVLTGNGDVYMFTFEKQLVSGNNQFSIAGDIKQDAAFDAQVKAAVNGVTTTTHPEGVSGFLAAEPQVLTVARVVLMSSEARTYDVSGPMTFYDDGGEDGNISEQFYGQVTFKPTTPGSKVMIDFTKLDLFNTSSTGLNDLLKIYYGDTADEDNLAITLLKEKTAIIKSVADNGALTVTLKSTTGYPKSGFEAVVSEFVPQQMTIDEIVVSQYTEGAVAAGDKDQLILSFNIQTENTEPALEAQKFSFTSNGTFEKLSKATLYYTGVNEAFSSLTKVGETEISSDAFVIASTKSITLREGDNYFWLAYDVKDNAQTNDLIDAAITSVTCSGNEQPVTAGNPDGNRKVENKYLSVIGNTEKVVYGTWIYEHSPQSSYASYYAGTAGEQIITFRPGTAGMIMEMEFTKFSIRYYSYAGGDPVFKIYSGTEATGEPIWSLTKDNKDVGPGVKIRSKSADGALTVVFNANNNAGSTGNGWHAEVREYRSKPMAVSNVSAFQASTKVISIASAAMNQEIIGFKVVTDGDQSALLLHDINLDLKGAQDKVAKVYVYTSGRDSVLITSAAMAEAIPAVGSKDLKLTLNNPIELPEGTSYYWVAYDMKEGVAAEQAIDAALISLKVGDENIVSSAGDPDGERITKNIYLMGTGDVVVDVESSLMFYDDGGADNNYSKVSNGTITFVPKQGDVIKLVFKSFNTHINDDFYIYSGRETTSANQLAKYYNEKTDLPDLISKADDGTITIKFKATSTLKPGWEIEVISITPEPLSLGEVKVVAVNNISLLKGMMDVPMLRVDVEVLGEKGSFDITELNFDPVDTTNESVTAVNVYCTDTLSNFSTDNKFAETLIATPYAFSGSYTTRNPGTYKFWLTYDITPNAALDDKIEAKLTSLTANGTQVQPDPIIASATITAGFSGTYTIGESGDYPTIKAAVEAMKNGIDGAVVFELESGEYNELVEIPEIPGSSAINTITFKSGSGNYQDVKIYYNRYSEPSYSDDKMFLEYGVFTVAGADYLTLDGVTVTTTDLTFPSVVHIKNVSRHVTVKNCHIYAAMTTNYSADINLVYQYAQNLANRNNDYFTLENCLLEGGYNGIRVGGTTYVALPKQKGAVIINNTLRNQGAKGIYIPGEAELTVKGNVITNTETDKTDFNAIDATAYEGLLISGNVINLATKNYACGLYLRNASGTSEKQGYVINNEINLLCAGNSTSSGIKLSSPSSYLNIAYNTVRMRGTADGVALFVNDVMNNTFVQNNIFQNEAKGYVYRLYKTTCLEGITYSNNMLYTDSETLFAKLSSSEDADWESWKTQSGETDSYVERTTFLSDDVLEPAEMGHLNHAKPLVYVTTDLNGTVRNAVNPTIGAYEFADQTIAPVMGEGYPVISGVKHNEATITVKSSLSGKVFLLVKSSEDTAPTADEVKTGICIDVRKDKVVTALLENLDRQTDYQCYIVLQNLRAIDSGVLVSELFTTSYLPTEVSTFENVDVAPGEDFEDGTASFSGFTVEAITDGVATSKKAAKLGIDGGLITLTNSTGGLKLTGFYLKSDAETSMTAYGKNAEENTTVLASTDGKWIFTNLKDKGEITAVMMSSAGNVYIDNFSGEPQPISFMVANQSVNEGENVTLSTEVSGGVPPYIYSWTNAKNEVIFTEKSYTFAPQHIEEYTLTVTDAWNVSAMDKAVVSVEGNAYVATFDNLYLKDESYWDSTKENDGNYLFYSGSYAFTNKVGTSYGVKYWDGFSYSNISSTAFSGLKDQYNSAVGSGVDGSSNYAVAYVGGSSNVKVVVKNAVEGDILNGCYISNNAWAVDAITTGDGVSKDDKGFVTEDWFKLTAEGKDKNGNTKIADFYLADYRSTNEADHYYLDTWQWFDLRSLGKVTEVSFKLNSTKNNAYGMTTPSYFCMDNFNGVRNLTDVAEQTVGLEAVSINMAQFFTLNDAAATVVYQIEDAFDTDIAEIAVDENTLTITGKKDGNLALVVSATQKGKKQFVRLPVTVDSSIVGMEKMEMAQVSIYPVPVTNLLTVASVFDNYSLEVVSVNGTTVLRQDNNSGISTINVGGLEKGVYILKISNDKLTVMKRFTKVD